MAVTSFGLAAALAPPVHADVQELGHRAAPQADEPGGKGGGPLGGLLSPVTGLLGGLLGGGGGLLGGGKKSAPAEKYEGQAEPRGPIGPNSYEDATRWSEPRPELAPRVAGLPLLGGLGKGLPLAGGLPLGGVVPGASRLAVPQNAKVKPNVDGTLHGAFASVADLVEGSLSGAMAKLSTTRLLPGGTTSVVDASNTTTDTLNGTTQGLENLSLESTMAGLGAAAKHALPHASRGELSPLIGHLTPAEAAPLIESLPGTTQIAAVDEVSPLVEDVSNVLSTNGTKATGSYNETITSLGWSTAALTRHAADAWPTN
ncbi:MULTISPECIES: hypothetical protein [Nonomuraea]|uniref:hypothetical protein n=1 Tax=Nonomuraea TaxID=83681 RepID=UPI001C5D0A9E|nr:hypothetical protein [Nonomuraea ceibae]